MSDSTFIAPLPILTPAEETKQKEKEMLKCDETV